MKRLYVDVHILQTVPPANLNRDDLGRPKEAYYGGARRSRVSSQAWKRATRMQFAEEVPAYDLGTRTKKIGVLLAARIADRTGLEADSAARLAGAMLAPLGIKAGKKLGDTAYLLFYGQRQLESIVDLVAQRATHLAALDKSDLADAIGEMDMDLLGKLASGHPVDVALFGRMVADIPKINVDAAVQVAHALSTHATEPEIDYFTAVDDESAKDEPGAGMIGNISFNSATLYRYATVGLHQLAQNLDGTPAPLDALELFVSAFARSMPTGYVNSFAHGTRPSLVAVVVRGDQPVNLVTAFEDPVPADAGIAAESARRLALEYSTSVKSWGDTPLHTAICHSIAPHDKKNATVPSALTTAFGETVTFPNLLAGLRTTLSEAAQWTGR